MISHRGTEAALECAAGERPLARDLIRADIITQAERLAKIAGCSLKCQADNHADEPYGCANDGSTCICACHDQPTEETE